MRSKTGFYVLLGLAIAMVAAVAMVQQSSNRPASSFGLHAPGLSDRADEIRSVVIRTAETSLRLERADPGWVARSRHDYPADTARIRQLVLGIGHLRRLEKKTDNPERLQRLELRDIEEPGSQAVQVTLLAGAGEELANILVGKTEDFQQAGRSRYYVRDAGDSQSWLVEGSLPPVLGEVKNWLERSLLPGVAEAGLQSVTVDHADGGSLTIQRGALEDADFQISGLSSDEEIESQYRINAVAEIFRRLSLEDVRAADAASPNEVIATVEALTFNGVRITARIGKADPDYGVRLSAGYEPDLDHGAGDGESGTDGEQLARDLERRWHGRSFVVSQYALDDLLVRRADLVSTPEASGAE